MSNIDAVSTNHDLEENLQKFGLSPIETSIYLFLLSKDPRTVLEISASLRLPRTSVYDHVEKLLNRGFIERIVKYKSQQFRAYPLEILETLIEKQKEELTSLSQSYTYLKEHIHLTTSNAVPSTQVRYYHGVSGFKQMMWNALSAKKEHVGYSIFGRRTIVGNVFLKRFLEEMKERHIEDRVIINSQKETLDYITTEISKKNKPLSFEHIRTLPSKQFYISGDTTIYNNVFAVMYWKEGEIVGVEIENPELVKTQKSMFEILWSIAKPLNQK